MIRVRYSGPIRGAHMLSRQLSDGGFEAEFPPHPAAAGVALEIKQMLLDQFGNATVVQGE